MTHRIPQPPGVPLLGNIFDINPSNTWLSLQRLAETYGEIFQLTVLGHTVVFVASAALAGELCDETRFRKHVGGPIVEIRAAVHDALFAAFDDEPAWGVAHRILAPRLAPAAVARHCPAVVALTGELLARLLATAPTAEGSGGGGDGGDDDGVLLLDELNRLSLDATTLTLFGQRLDRPSQQQAVLAAMEAATSEAMRRPARPALLNRLLYGAKFRGAIHMLRDDYAARLVAQRRAGGGGGAAAATDDDDDDVLAALLGAADPATGARLSARQVIDEIVSMPIGSSTAPALVASAVHFLARHARCARRARAEVDGVLGPPAGGAAGARGGRAPTAADLRRLPYVEGVVREALRLSCAAPGFNVEPVPRADGARGPPVLLGGGKYAVAHDQAMVVVLAGVNRDPAVFGGPDEGDAAEGGEDDGEGDGPGGGGGARAFRPERMMGARYEALPPAVKKGFGNGKRECIGKHWAWQFCMVVVAMLVQSCDLEAVDEHWELDGRQDGWFNLRPVEMRVRVRARTA